ncbi:hypothetical protein NC652_001297 [Populus alba x Populus x berolinensis]|nr:hypothetical protein NC652_001297 [Populus alba x Populus x berolinensis]
MLLFLFLFLFSQILDLFRTGVREERACKATKDSTAMQSSAYAKWISFSCIVPLALSNDAVMKKIDDESCSRVSYTLPGAMTDGFSAAILLALLLIQNIIFINFSAKNIF